MGKVVHESGPCIAAYKKIKPGGWTPSEPYSKLWTPPTVAVKAVAVVQSKATPVAPIAPVARKEDIRVSARLISYGTKTDKTWINDYGSYEEYKKRTRVVEVTLQRPPGGTPQLYGVELIFFEADGNHDIRRSLVEMPSGMTSIEKFGAETNSYVLDLKLLGWKYEESNLGGQWAVRVVNMAKELVGSAASSGALREEMASKPTWKPDEKDPKHAKVWKLGGTQGPDLVRCPNCGGFGRVTGENKQQKGRDGKMKCPKCNGSGKIKAPKQG